MHMTQIQPQIWNHNNKLVRTLVLNTIPSAITFGNHEGDILLTIKNEIRRVGFKIYLPEEYLKHMIGVQYPIEVSLELKLKGSRFKLLVFMTHFR